MMHTNIPGVVLGIWRLASGHFSEEFGEWALANTKSG